MSINTDALAKAKAKLKLLDAEKEQPKDLTKKKVSKRTNDYLFQALETAIHCVDILPAEEERIHQLVEEIKADKDNDDNWELKVEYHLKQLELMKQTYPLFSEEAIRRKELIESVTKRNKWNEEIQKCKEDTMYWFNNYAWTSDPRKSGIWSLPFMLYPYQIDAIEWLEKLIFTKKSSGVIEKSRDLGFSWLLVSLFYKHWQHSEGFHALIGSITADECDTIGDHSSMFEKIREQSRLQPKELLPVGWDGNVSYMKAVNPVTKSTITGSTSNADFGRGGRYSVILFDEFSSFEMDTAAMTASSQSSPCKIYNSTAKGMGNEFYRLAHNNKVEKKTYHWTSHPHKTDVWYRYQGLEMSDLQIAQELDINYDASQPNKVYSMYKEYVHVVTKSEVMRALPSFRDSNGKFQIPVGHNIYMGEDVGQTAEHAHMMMWFATLRENTKTVDGIDVSGSVFVYRERQISPKTPPRVWANTIREEEGVYESKMISNRFISHEATTEVETYADEYNLYFEKWNPDYNTGISRVKDYLDIVLEHTEHPFREHTRKLKYPDAPPIMGRPRIFFIVDDEQGELMYDNVAKRYYLTPAIDDNGFIRTRYEFPMYHFPTSELGKEVKKMRPKKKDDDAMDIIRCIATECFPPINKQSINDIIENKLPNQLKLGNIDRLPTSEMGMAFLQRQQELDKQKKSQEYIGVSYRDKLLSQLRK